MLIRYVKMRNYRQYRDAQISFSDDPARNFTVAQGANGAGKSNLLNAITWCLYGEERHLKKDKGTELLPLVNERVLHELPPGETVEVEVEVALGDGQNEYLVRRQAKAHRLRSGEVSVVENADPFVLFRTPNGSWRNSDQPTFTINSLLPPSISHFFFFDGEQLDGFFRSGSRDRVANDILRVSQIDLLKKTIEHLDNVKSGFRKRAEGVSPRVDGLRAEMDRKEELRKALRQKIARLQEDCDGVQSNLDDIADKLRNSTAEEVRQLQERREDLVKQKNDHQVDLDHLRSKAAAAFVRLAPMVNARSALIESRRLIEERVKHDELPPKVRGPFFKELLDQGACVCGRELCEGSHEWRRIEEAMERVASRPYEMAIDGRYKVANVFLELPRLVQDLKEIRRVILADEDGIESCNRALKEISERIEKYGEVNLQEIEVLEHQRREYEAVRGDLERTIGREGGEEEALSRQLDHLERDLRRALEDDKRQKELIARLDLCTEALTVLKDIRDQMLSEVREQIQEKTQAYFLELMWKKNTYKAVEIDDKYQISVLNVRDMPSLGTLSAGERQVLALAFMAALGSISGFEAPIIIDTPIGRISGEPRENIAEALPMYLERTQVTMLMTDTEYTESVKLRLKRRVGKEYRLQFDEAAAATEVTAL